MLELAPVWRLQPAQSPDVAPKEDDWGTRDIQAADWRWGAVNAKGTSWEIVLKEKDGRAKVHCLWHEQTVAVPAAWVGRRLVLGFKRIEGDAIVFLNGQRVAELLRPGGDLDVSATLQPGKDNTLRVYLTRDYTGISRDFEHDPLRYTARGPGSHAPTPLEKCGFGITAPVTLYAFPRPVSISDVFVRTSWRQKNVALDVELTADAPVDGLSLQAVIRDADGKDVLTLDDGPAAVPAGRTVRTLTRPWADPICWELEKGYLYTATVTLSTNGTVADSAPPVRFGFRELWTEGRHVYLNGHVSRWRVDWTACGLNPTSLSFFRLMGRNVFYTQANPSAWWSVWSETPLLDEKLLDAFDAQGMGSFVPAPAVCHVRTRLLDDPQAQADYDREVQRWLRLYRNHPCILGWTIGMNSFCPRDGIHPPSMGKRTAYPSRSQATVIEKGLEMVKHYDPTRLVYSHADGNVGDISTSNSYLNFAPLQEREEWPSEWARAGDMPYFPVEFGQPYTANFWKGTQFLATEYLAMYFGDRAYRDETLDGLRNTLKVSLENKSGHGSAIPYADFPLYWEFQHLFVRNTDRTWRTWGVPGWYYWDFGVGYGNPTKWDGKSIWSRYAAIDKPLTERPDWASPNFDIRAENEQALLVWLAGAPRHTDKTHAFYPGETIRKQVAAVWDGPGDKSIDVQWRLADSTDRELKSGTARLDLKAGDIAFAPIEVAAPDVPARAGFALSMLAKDGDRVVGRDTAALQVFPKEPPARVAGRVALFDPAGKSGPWLTALGVKADACQTGQQLADTDLLILGRESLRQGMALPYSAADIARGLRVLVLEQQPEIWDGLGFQSIETMPRYVFARDAASPILAGIAPEDLINWRGSPDLLPEYKPARSHEVMHAPKWTNTHAVASCVLQIPHVVGFNPILVAEFDLDYSPLLTWRYGKGCVFFCTLDLTDRVGQDPAATRLARNLLETATAPCATPPRTTCFAGDAQGRARLERLGVTVRQDVDLAAPAERLLVVGDGDNVPGAPELDRFTQGGGTVLFLPRTAAQLEKDGFKTAATDVVRAAAVEHPLFRGVGPSLLRWRDAIHAVTFTGQGQPPDATVVGDGLFVLRKQGGGTQCFVQLDPFALDSRYADDSPEREATQLSMVRLRQLWAQLLTNAGATGSDAIASRVTTLKAGPSYEILGHWFVLGPFAAAEEDAGKPGAVLDTEFPGEKAAIAGDTNPNITYTRADGKPLDFRTMVQADKNDFMNLAATLKAGEQSVAYATCTVKRDKAGTAVLRLGVDYWMKVWVNGELLYRMDQGHGAPKPNRHQVKANLKAGENVITIKVLAGSKGFGFWANLATCEETAEQSSGVVGGDARLYDPSIRLRDPYEYAYW
ncbi:MAG: hypothetical protein A3K19_10755 [Lentisphaerae bacterium RIFOXYB12_FULL_65_16]|nr:MAG: hypothetical protein A3K18_28480 [Lentisphaerae bacterium RIFOXYA12_64_32]OGV87866.1 MAG: hypothetical protein A3K19_10755 [Lentisphaerae bacterium RIFOXYB12_FULL_65_16]